MTAVTRKSLRVAPGVAPPQQATVKQEVIATLREAMTGCQSGGDREWPRTSTGFAALDDVTGGGLFLNALNEVVVSESGSGAAEVLLRSLVQLDREASRTRWNARKLIAWVARPGRPDSSLGRVPYPPALAQAGLPLERCLLVRPPRRDDHLWAAEQLLRSGVCHAVVTSVGSVHDRVLRRLQLAAQEGKTLGLLFRPVSVTSQSTPAALRLRVKARPVLEESPSSPPSWRRRADVEILRCRGLAPQAPIALEWFLDPLDELDPAGLSRRTADPVLGDSRRRAARARRA